MEKVARKNGSFGLGDPFTSFIDSQIEEGRYGNARDVVRAGMRVLEEQETQPAALRAALI